MNGWGSTRRCAVGVLAVCCAALTWTGAMAERKQPAEIVGSEAIGGKDRYLVHASTDKPVYRNGRPVGAVVGLTVTDDNVLELIEKREQAPRLPVMVLLEPEVRELADARVYLDPTNAKALLAPTAIG